MLDNHGRLGRHNPSRRRMMRSTHLILMAGLLLSVSSQAAGIKPDPLVAKTEPVPLPVSTWDALLTKYVDDAGRVDYVALKNNFADIATPKKCGDAGRAS